MRKFAVYTVTRKQQQPFPYRTGLTEQAAKAMAARLTACYAVIGQKFWVQ